MPLDQLDAVVVRISDEADPRAALRDLVRRSLRLDAVLTCERRERAVEVVDADRDVPVCGAELVGASVVVVGQLEDVLRISEEKK